MEAMQDSTFDQPQELVVHVEACLYDELESYVKDEVSAHIRSILASSGIGLKGNVLNRTWVSFSDDTFLDEHVKWIKVCEPDHYDGLYHFSGTESIKLHLFTLYDYTCKDASESGDESEEGPSYQEITLPSVYFDRLWESLVFNDSLKSQLLDYIQSSLLFSDSGVDSTVISWNRLMLLHGPPGTGKTSLCKALSQKIAIRLSERFAKGHFIEINAHSLFSKWFSESGKLVMKMFDKVRELVEKNDAFVFLMIDEVESLTAARNSALSGSEPSDAIRVVNALLTQIDTLKECSNVLVMATSNITEAIDSAFLDRADLKLHIGLPSLHARYIMLKSGIDELTRVGIIVPVALLLDYKTCRLLQKEIDAPALQLSLKLLAIARAAKKFSGRALRKLPFIAHALFLQGRSRCTPAQFLRGLEVAVEKHKAATVEMGTSKAAEKSEMVCNSGISMT